MENCKYVPFSDCDKICRTCLRYSRTDLLPIKATLCDNVQLSDILQLYLSINLEENVELPQYMCENCTVQMFNTHKFLEKCRSSEPYLQDALKVFKNSSGMVYLKVVDEVGCDYVFVDSRVTEKNNVGLVNNDNPMSIEEFNSIGILNKVDSEIIENNNNIGIVNIGDLETITLNGDIEIDEDLKIIQEDNNIKIVGNEHSYAINKPNNISEIADNQITTGESNQESVLEIQDSVESESLGGIINFDDITQDSMPEIDSLETYDEVQKECSDSVKIKQKPKVKITRCKECFEVLENYGDLRKHWRIKNHFPRWLRCSYCSRGFGSTHNLKDHINVHTQNRVYGCTVCGRSFAQKNNFKRHMLIHAGEKKHKCEKCNKGFTRLASLHDHERQMHDRERFLCTYCGKAFTNHNNFLQHERDHIYTSNEGKKLSFLCNICGKRLGSKLSLERHQVNIHEGKRNLKERNGLQCTVCQVNFPNHYAMRQHKLESDCSPHIEKYTCEECGKIYFTSTAIYVHEKNHRDEKSNKSYKCKLCPATFRMYKDLNIHRVKHTKSRKHFCSYCNKGFFSSAHLRYHLRLHTGERPYTCDVCGKSFAIKGNLNAHAAQHMADRPKFECEFCDNIYLEKKGLKRHCKSIHGVNISL